MDSAEALQILDNVVKQVPLVFQAQLEVRKAVDVLTKLVHAQKPTEPHIEPSVPEDVS